MTSARILSLLLLSLSNRYCDALFTPRHSNAGFGEYIAAYFRSAADCHSD